MIYRNAFCVLCACGRAPHCHLGRLVERYVSNLPSLHLCPHVGGGKNEGRRAQEWGGNADGSHGYSAGAAGLLPRREACRDCPRCDSGITDLAVVGEKDVEAPHEFVDKPEAALVGVEPAPLGSAQRDLNPPPPTTTAAPSAGTVGSSMKGRRHQTRKSAHKSAQKKSRHRTFGLPASVFQLWSPRLAPPPCLAPPRSSSCGLPAPPPPVKRGPPRRRGRCRARGGRGAERRRAWRCGSWSRTARCAARSRPCRRSTSTQRTCASAAGGRAGGWEGKWARG